LLEQEIAGAKQAAEKGLILVLGRGEILQGINGWVETHPYQPSLVLRHFRPVTQRVPRRALTKNKNASSTKRDAVMQFYGLPPIGQKQRRPMDGAQFHPPRVGEAGGKLIKNMVPVGQCIAGSKRIG
jgi:hypothetical protein